MFLSFSKIKLQHHTLHEKEQFFFFLFFKIEDGTADWMFAREGTSVYIMVFIQKSSKSIHNAGAKFWCKMAPQNPLLSCLANKFLNASTSNWLYLYLFY